MAVGAITVTKQGVLGNMKYAIVNVVGATSYTTTGDALDLNAVCGMTNIYMVSTSHFKTTAPTVVHPVWEYDIVSKKLQGFATAAGATGLTELTNGGSFAASTIVLFVLGS